MSKSFLEIQIEEAEKDYALAIERHVGASEQLRSNLDGSQKPVKKLILEQCAKEAKESWARLEKLKAERDVRVPPAPQKGKHNLLRQAVLVGVDRYWHYPDLDVCASDAGAVGAALAEGEDRNENIEVVTDAGEGEVDRERIAKALEKAVAAKEADLLLFYFSGHGDTSGEESYLVMPGSREDNLPETGVPLNLLRQVVEISPARSKVIIIDSCHSGASFAAKGKPGRTISMQHLNHLYTQAKGWAVLASCEQDQLSYVWIERSRSVFTHFLLEALAGEADYQGLGFVSVQHVYSYVQPRVTEWAQQKYKKVQIPKLSLEVAGDIILANISS